MFYVQELVDMRKEKTLAMNRKRNTCEYCWKRRYIKGNYLFIIFHFSFDFEKIFKNVITSIPRAQVTFSKIEKWENVRNSLTQTNLIILYYFVVYQKHLYHCLI